MSSRHWVWVAATVTGLCLGTAATADARIRNRDLVDPGVDYSQRGFQLYAGLGGQSYEIEDHDYQDLEALDGSPSFFFGAGLGLSRSVSLYFEGSGSEHETALGDVTFGTAMFGVKVAPNSGHRHPTQPYGKIALGGMFLWEDDSPYAMRHDRDDDNGYVGPAVGLALGIDHFIGRRTAIFGEVGMTTGQLDQRIIEGEDYDLADDIDMTSGRIQFGLRFRL